MNLYWHELFTVSAIIILTVVTPGPDFAVVVRNSLCHYRRAGVLAAMGVGLAVWIHIAYSIIGTGWAISHSKSAFSIIRILGGLYLIYLGIQSLFEKMNISTNTESVENSIAISDSRAFFNGFLNNALNPKASAFFLSLFSQFVSQTTPFFIKVGYGLICTTICVGWFSFVAVIITNRRFRPVISGFQFHVMKIMGFTFIGFGLYIIVFKKLS